MTTGHDAAAIGALLRRRGLPTRPVVGVPVTEIRSDSFLGQIPTLDSGVHSSALAGLILEWNYALPYHMVPEVLQFLTDNDLFIADACRKMMTGVTYFGTYMGATGERASFKTIWGYAAWGRARRMGEGRGHGRHRELPVVRPGAAAPHLLADGPERRSETPRLCRRREHRRPSVPQHDR